MNARETVDLLLEDASSPFAKTPLKLEYRPYKTGDQWTWHWVLHSEGRQRAVAHGQKDSRAAASTEARLRARQLKGVITKVDVAKYARRWLPPQPPSSPRGSPAAPAASTASGPPAWR